MKTNNKIVKFLKNYNYQWKFKLLVCLPVFLVLVAIDWISKGAVQATMNQGDTVGFIKGFLDFQFIINPGSAYGFNANNLTLAVSLASVMTFLLIVAFIFSNGKSWLVGLTIILAGSFANLLARSWAPGVDYPLNAPNLGVKGGVIDFLHWDFDFFGSNNYIFNFADLWVILGVVALIIGLIVDLVFSLKKSSKTNKYNESEKTHHQSSSSKTVKKAKFNYKDETKMNDQEKKRYLKELKAYQKMEKMEQKKHEKKARKSNK